MRTSLEQINYVVRDIKKAKIVGLITCNKQITPHSLVNTIVGVQANFRVSYQISVI